MLRKMSFKSSPVYGVSVPPSFDGKKFSAEQNLVIPTHDQYNLDDLLNAGVKVSPVDTAILHDAGAADRNISILSQSASSSDDVKPSNND